MIETIPKEQFITKPQLSTDLTNLSLEIGNTYDQINNVFIDRNAQEKSIQEARDILQIPEGLYTDTQVQDLVNEVEFLVESWLDEFERNTYDGKNLDELVGLKI